MSAPGAAYWEHFHHEADVGVRGIAPDVAGAFAQAALATVAVVCSLERIRPSQPVQLRCEGSEEGDLELLLYAFLNELVFEMATRRMLFARVEVELEGTGLRARLWGEPVDVPRHRPAVEVKGATMTELRVCRQPDGRWLAQLVVDV